MLRTTMPGYVLRELGKALLRYAEASPEAFAHLFDPLTPRLPVLDEPEHTRLLRICGLVSGDERLVGNHRIRRQGDHLYLMELGDVEYFQDLWPETDALLDELLRLPRGRLLDLGCGCGIVALEAAALGHQVVATDLDPQAVRLSRINAQLNGIEGVDFREGDLYAPVAGERFDAILTAPHYGRVYNQLRVQVLRDGSAYLNPDGKLLLATVMEWEAPGVLPIVKVLDQRLPADVAVAVRPIESALKRTWFWTARSPDADADAASLPRIPSEHRFLVELHRLPDGQASRPSAIAWPEAPLVRDFVPLHRLLAGPEAPSGRGVLVDRRDVERLRELVARLGERELLLEGALPQQLHDACRLGKQPCVAPRGGAAGAIVDGAGRVRPCAFGEPIGSFDDDFATLDERYRQARVALEARRGCATCPAEWMCSRCLHPTPFEETEYCDFVRDSMRRQPVLMRLFEIGQQLVEQGVTHGPVRIFRSPWGPPPVTTDEDDMGRTGRRELDVLRERWNHEETWSISAGERAFLSFYRAAEFQLVEIDPIAAAVGEKIADGATATELHQLARDRRWPTTLIERSRRKLAAHLANAATTLVSA